MAAKAKNEQFEEELTPGQIDKIQEMIQALLPSPDPSPSHGPAGDLFILKYRRGMAGVMTGFIRASTLQSAEKVGHAYCDSLPGCRYINTTKAVIADESILGPHKEAQELRDKLAAQ